MDTIDISQNIQDFKQVFENESRIIFSARFGDGKSYCLNEFMKSYDEKKNDYYFITLHPVNYLVEENRDVIEYIKRDILFQLIKDNRIYDFKEGCDKIFDAVCNKESLLKLADFVASIIPVEGIKDVYEGLKGLASTIHKKYKEQDVLHVADDYLNGFYGKMGSISECDAFTCLIQKSLEQMMAKSVLIIEDLDRIVPAHLFHHFYGNEANYEGYMNKFLNTLPFRYSIKEEAHRQVRQKIFDICKTEEVLSLDQSLSSETNDRISVPLAIYQLSVRRSKEFLDIDINSLFRDNWLHGEYNIQTDIPWVRILVCLRFLMSDKSLGKIYEAMIHGFTDMQLVELAAPLYLAKKRESLFYVEIEDATYQIEYQESLKQVKKNRCRGIGNGLKKNIADIINLLRNVQNNVCNLLIG